MADLRRHWGIALVLFPALLVLGARAEASGNFQITINAQGGLAANQPALDAFNRAADEWSSRITSAFPVNVVINADLADLGGGGVLGRTKFTGISETEDQINQPFDVVRNAMAARAGRPGDAILAFLPTSATIQAHTIAPNTFDNTRIGVLRANQKALGLLTPASTKYNDPDGTIEFNSRYNFNFANAQPNFDQIDFQSVAAHEIGHVLGFSSDVDDYDNKPYEPDDLTTLDLFRFSLENAPPNALAFAAATRELSPGVESVTSDTINAYRMSTGFVQGDGNQASHWRDDQFFDQPFVGLMDPTLSFGTVETVGDADLRAMELIGYDTVPEPAGLAIFGALAVWAALRRDTRPPAATREASPSR